MFDSEGDGLFFVELWGERVDEGSLNFWSDHGISVSKTVDLWSGWKRKNFVCLDSGKGRGNGVIRL